MYGVIVEGTSDALLVKRVNPFIHVIVTNGTRMNNRVRNLINDALIRSIKLFILSDPDEAGDNLAKMLLNEYPFLIRIPLDREQCRAYYGKRIKIGVEHCSDEYLLSVLSQYMRF